jgi:hypothetical protein
MTDTWQDIPTSDRPKGHPSTWRQEVEQLRAKYDALREVVSRLIEERDRALEWRDKDWQASQDNVALRERVAELEAVLEPLLLRLCEWAADNLTDESARDWFGYVEPPLERARAALQTGLQCDEGTMGDNGS